MFPPFAVWGVPFSGTFFQLAVVILLPGRFVVFLALVTTSAKKKRGSRFPLKIHNRPNQRPGSVEGVGRFQLNEMKKIDSEEITVGLHRWMDICICIYTYIYIYL